MLVCGLHHRLIHDRGHRLARSPEDGRFVSTRPDGSVVPGSGPPTAGRADRLVAEHTRARIDDRTITPDRQGERLDLHYAASVLLPELRGNPPLAA